MPYPTMSCLTPTTAGGLVAGIAAVIAGVITLPSSVPAENGSPAANVNRVGKTDRLEPARGLRTVFFSGTSMAFDAELNRPHVPGITIHEVTVERAPVQQRINTKRPANSQVDGCETGLSSDLSPTVPLNPGQCIV